MSKNEGQWQREPEKASHTIIDQASNDDEPMNTLEKGVHNTIEMLRLVPLTSEQIEEAQVLYVEILEQEKDWVEVWNKLRRELEGEKDPTIVLDKFFIFWMRYNHQIQKDFQDLWQGTVDTLAIVLQQVDLAVRVYERLNKEYDRTNTKNTDM